MTPSTDPVLQVAELLREIMARTEISPVLLDRDQFAAILGVGTSTFDRLRASGEIGPHPIRLGGALRWHRDEVWTWLKRRTQRGELLNASAWPGVWKSAAN